MRLLGVDSKYFHSQSNKILRMEKLVQECRRRRVVWPRPG
jgi:hypothetical protein